MQVTRRKRDTYPTSPHAMVRTGFARIAVLVAVLVVLAIIVVWMWRGAPPSQPEIAEGRAVAEQFLALVRSGQPQQAWESTTAEFKSAEGRESFGRFVKKHAFLLKPLSFVSMQTVTLEDNPRSEFLYSSADGKGTVRLLVGNEGSVWRVDRITVD
jgi:hypothetical protein